MLVLKFQPGQKAFITFGDLECEVQLVRTAGDGGVYLGFEAPLAIEIVREKVRNRLAEDRHDLL